MSKELRLHTVLNWWRWGQIFEVRRVNFFYRYRWLITSRYFVKTCKTKVFDLSRSIMRWQKLSPFSRIEMCNSRERLATRENGLSNSRERIVIWENELSNSRERIAIRENELSNSRERITNPWELIEQFDITIFLWLFFFFKSPFPFRAFVETENTCTSEQLLNSNQYSK